MIIVLYIENVINTAIVLWNRSQRVNPSRDWSPRLIPSCKLYRGPFSATGPFVCSDLYCKQFANQRQFEYQLILTSRIPPFRLRLKQTLTEIISLHIVRDRIHHVKSSPTVLLTTWLLSSKLLLKLRLLKTTQRSSAITGLASWWFVDGEETRPGEAFQRRAEDVCETNNAGPLHSKCPELDQQMLEWFSDQREQGEYSSLHVKSDKHFV